MRKTIFILIKKLLCTGIITMLFFLFSCSEPQENHSSKATDLRGPEPEPIIEVILIEEQSDEFVYQITNTGNDVLKLTSSVVISGNNAFEYSVIEQPSLLEIESDQSTTFKIRYNPQSAGEKNANINIWNNTDNNPYTFTLNNNEPEYTLTIDNSKYYMRGNVSPSDTITYIKELKTTIFADPGKYFYFYKWEVVSGNVTIDQPYSKITPITLNGGDAVVIRPIFFAFDPSEIKNINLDKTKIIPYGSHDYAFINHNLYWEKARDFCKNNGGYLATITSKEENNFIVDNIIEGTGDFWIGGHDISNDRYVQVWQWVTGEKFDNDSYKKWDLWANGEPNDRDWDEKYLEIYKRDDENDEKHGRWNDEDIDSDDDLHMFICEWGNLNAATAIIIP